MFIAHQQRFTSEEKYSVCPSNMHGEAVMNCVQKKVLPSFLASLTLGEALQRIVTTKYISAGK
jgi:hypothetical protein